MPSRHVPLGRLNPDRRTLLRASAWSVPVIATTTAAPALASVSGVYASHIDVFEGGIFYNAWVLGVSLSVSNDAGSPGPQTGYIVNIKVSDSWLSPDPPQVTTPPTEWQSGLIFDTSDGNYVYRYTYTGMVQPGDSASTLGLQFTMQGDRDHSLTFPVEVDMTFPQVATASFTATS